MHGLENHPTLTAVAKTADGVEHSFLVKPIQLVENCKPYALVTDKGALNPAQVSTFENGQHGFLFFNAVWVEDGEVWTLDIITKEKKVHIGKLVSLMPGISDTVRAAFKGS